MIVKPKKKTLCISLLAHTVYCLLYRWPLSLSAHTVYCLLYCWSEDAVYCLLYQSLVSGFCLLYRWPLSLSAPQDANPGDFANGRGLRERKRCFIDNHEVTEGQLRSVSTTPCGVNFIRFSSLYITQCFNNRFRRCKSRWKYYIYKWFRCYIGCKYIYIT